MRIKICGITRPGDAEQALALGADTVGCVFHAESARHVTAEVAQDIKIAVGNAGTLVGLFVDPTVDQVQAVLDRIDLDVLQFHGQESPAFCDQFQRPYLKAVAMSADVDLSAVNKAYESARGLLLDSAHEGQFGGTGQRFDWDWIDAGLENRLMLAGGVIVYGAVGVAGMMLDGLFLDYNVLAYDASKGQHYGILLVEFGVGLTVTGVMLALFHAFAGFMESHYKSGEES